MHDFIHDAPAGTGSATRGWIEQALFTALWLLLALLLLWRQGVLRHGCRAAVRTLGKRLVRRLGRPQGRWILTSLLVFAIGGGLGILQAWLTGFFVPVIPGLQDALIRLCALLVAPAFVEEVFFRGLFVRDAGGSESVQANDADAPSSQPAEQQQQQQQQQRQAQREDVPMSPTRSLSSLEAGMREAGAKQPTSDAAAAAAGALGRLPPPSERILHLLVFVVYHLGFPHGQQVFADWRFLANCALAALCFEEVVVRTGSLWPGVVMHQVWVWIWLCFGGGLSRF